MLILLLATGFAVGVLSALLGVGGGVFFVPFLVIVLDEPQLLAQGTSLVVVIPTAIVGFLAHRRYHRLQFRTIYLLGVGGVAGVVLGVALAIELDSRILQIAFGGVVAVVGGRTIADGISSMRRSRPQPSG